MVKELDRIVDTYLYMLPDDNEATDENIGAAKEWYDKEMDKYLETPSIRDC